MSDYRSPFALAPEHEPTLSAWDRVAARLLPEFLRPRWLLELFVACELARFEAAPARDDIQVEWIEHPRELQARHKEFMVTNLTLRKRLLWLWRLRRSGVWLGLATWNQMIAAYILVQISAGGGLHRYARLMREESCVVGPVATIPAARGRGIYPYLMNSALKRCRDVGLAWAYLSVQYQNEASIRGIKKEKNWAYVGRLLLRRNIGAPYFHIAAATLEDFTLTRLAE